MGLSIAPPKIELSKLPQSGPNFLGREAELQLLDEAWADGGRTHVVVLVAAGGVGKTTLVKRWLDRLKADGWRGAGCVYAWSFYSQGASEDRQASDDPFLNDALSWFDVEYDPAFSPWEKGRLLAGAISRTRTLLVLDGLEPLQHPPGPLGGQLRAPGVQALLWALARAGQPGLCIVTTREAVRDLAEYERIAKQPAGGVVAHDLGNLDETDGARLLHRLGVTHAGAAAIAEDDAELRATSREVRGHALALALLGRYLVLARYGDIRKRDLVSFEEADEEIEGGHAFRVMDAYVAWLKTSKQNRPLLAVLRVLGLFDRPADAGCLAALRKSPAITGLTEPLLNVTQAQWNITLSRLAGCGLISRPEQISENSLPALNDRQSLDTHPLIRTYFAKQLRGQKPQAWRAAHWRLFEHLKASVPYRPEGLAGLQPLYQAVAHGCQAGQLEQALKAVFIARILRGTGYDGFYSTKKLGAVGADLGAVAYFFQHPWTGLAPALSGADQAWLLNAAAFCLRALGRLTEAREPFQTSRDMRVEENNWQEAAVSTSNLSELDLVLGEVAAAVRDAEHAVAFADLSGDGLMRVVTRTWHADALHCVGNWKDALMRFREAETLQAVLQPDFPLLYSVRGFQYCDLLLAESSRAAWLTSLPSNLQLAADARKGALQSVALREVERRATQAIQWEDGRLLDIALDHLTLCRVALYRAVLERGTGHPFGNSEPSGQDRTTDLNSAREQVGAAVDGLRAASTIYMLPLGLLTRAWLRCMEHDPDGAGADLDEAWQIAERGPMRLHMVDIHLHRARLFRDRAALEAAARLIEETGYHRRDEELADAHEALGSPAE